MLTTTAGLKRDDTGQREFHKGRYHTGVELPGLPQQALGCIWEHEATDVFLWKDLEGVFTSGLMTGTEAEQGAISQGHTAWLASVLSPLLLLFPLPGPPPVIYWFHLPFNSAWSPPL